MKFSKSLGEILAAPELITRSLLNIEFKYSGYVSTELPSFLNNFIYILSLSKSVDLDNTLIPLERVKAPSLDSVIFPFVTLIGGSSTFAEEKSNRLSFASLLSVITFSSCFSSGTPFPVDGVVRK